MTNRLVAAARAYKGAKFRHRGRSPRSLDCVGLFIRAYADCGVALPDVAVYGREPGNDDLVGNVARALGAPVLTAPVSMAELMAGDIVVIRYDLYPHHVMLVGDHPIAGMKTAIHMDGHYGRWNEHAMNDTIAAHITHVFRRPV